jgi:hypothetical protein
MLSQPRVTVSDVIPAPVEDVWAAIRGFDTLDEWHPVITDCTIEDGLATDQVGAVRNFQAGETTLREELLAYSDVERSYQYTILDGGGAKEDYLSEIRAIPVTESDETVVVWTGTFDAPPEAMADETEGTGKVYRAGLEGLAQQFE